MDKYVTTDWLNLRSEPVVKKGNVIYIMPPDTVVETLEDGATTGWLKVKCVVKKTVIQGYASQQYLHVTEGAVGDATEFIPQMAPAHLKTNRLVSRGQPAGAYPLNEPSFTPVDLTLLPPEQRKAAIHKMVQYLDVERSVRYLPTARSTFCNIYATDLAYSLGLYIPRVWWTVNAEAKVLRQEQVEAIYERTVLELNANALANWFESYGPSFGWRRVLAVPELQMEVNKGTLGIVVAQRTDLNRSGHIVAVVPEKAPDLMANRQGDRIVSPLQSQAGVRNKKYFTGNNWWEQPGKFRKFSFWINEK